jgi:hypothetical protein
LIEHTEEESVQFDATGMFGEFMKLRQGAGVRHGNLRQRLGPQLLHLCGISDQDPQTLIWRKVTRTIDHLIREYPAETKKILRTVLGMATEASHATLERRLGWLAVTLRWAPRTVRRRVDEALRMLAEDAVAEARISAAAARLGYAVETLDVTVTIEDDRVAVVQRALRIRAVHESLEMIHCKMSMPSPPSGQSPDPVLDIDVRGGRLVHYERRPGSEGDVIVYTVEPHHSIAKGETYDFCVRVKVPSEQPMARHFVVTPGTAVGSVRIRVRFDPLNPPTGVWRVNHALHREIDGVPAEDLMLQLDQSSTVGVVLHDFDEASGLASGVAWSWEPNRD